MLKKSKTKPLKFLKFTGTIFSGQITPKLYPVLMSDLEKELQTLTKLYLKYKNVVLSLRDLYQMKNVQDLVSEQKPGVFKQNPGTANLSEISQSSFRVSQSKMRAKRGDNNSCHGNSGAPSTKTNTKNKGRKNEDAVNKKKPYKRETL